jgi:hypothetical protein
VNIIDKLCSIPVLRLDLGATQQQDVSTDNDINNIDNVPLRCVYI